MEKQEKTTPAPVPKENADKRKERKTLTPETFRKRKKLLVYLLMGLAFLLVMYIIFAPSKSEKEKLQAEQGLNLQIPQVTGGELPDDKEVAYEAAQREQAENERQMAIGTLSDFFGITQQTNNRTEPWELAATPTYENENRNSSIRQSATAYRDIQHTLGNFYDNPSQYEAMQRQIDELQAQLDERNLEDSEKDEIQKQLQLMEKSYEMAAKYLPQSSETKVNPFEAAVERNMDDPLPGAHVRAERKEHSFVVLPDENSVVSALYQELPDSVFVAEQLQERNHRFLSATEIMEDIPGKNTLKVAVHETVTLKDGETVRLRLLEAARVANMHIPKNTLLTAVAKVQGNRLSLSVTSIEYRERIIAVNLSAYGMDGQPGIFIPNSEEMNAVKEVVAGMGQNAGTSFTFSSSAGQQLAADAGKGLMQGASQYLNKKMREVKVTLKSGHLLLLMQNK